MRVRKRKGLPKVAFRSAITTGRDILVDVDGRTAIARRFRDLTQLHIADLGGEHAGLSEGQYCLARRAACLTVHLEMMESKFAQNGGAETGDLEVYQRCANSLRRLLESLGIHRGRVARDIAPDLQTYAAERYGAIIEGKVNRSVPRSRSRIVDENDDDDTDD